GLWPWCGLRARARPPAPRLMGRACPLPRALSGRAHREPGGGGRLGGARGAAAPLAGTALPHRGDRHQAPPASRPGRRRALLQGASLGLRSLAAGTPPRLRGPASRLGRVSGPLVEPRSRLGRGLRFRLAAARRREARLRNAGGGLARRRVLPPPPLV